MLTLSNKSDYALLLISYLKNLKKEFVPLSVMVSATKLPPRFVARIASELTRHNILESREGKVGGYKLKANLAEVTMLDFLSIFEKELRLTKCEQPGMTCAFESICSHKKAFKSRLTEIITTELQRTTLSDIIS